MRGIDNERCGTRHHMSTARKGRGHPFRIVQGPHAHRRFALRASVGRPGNRDPRHRDRVERRGRGVLAPGLDRARLADERGGLGNQIREVVDQRPGAARLIADARVLTRPPRRLGRTDLGCDQVGERGSRLEPAYPLHRRSQPMPKRDVRLPLGAEGVHPLPPPHPLPPKRDERRAPQSMFEARLPAPLPPLGRPGPGRPSAVQPAAPVRHPRLPARAPAPCPRPAARREPEVAGRVPVPEPAGAQGPGRGGRD
jgi:hypothetical protein